MEYRGFHLQHQLREEYTTPQYYTTTSVNQSHYKPVIRQAWDSSNSIYCSNSNGYMNPRDVGQDFDFQAQQTLSESVARIKGEECCVNGSIILSSISEGDRHSKPQYCHATNNLCYVQKPILADGERGVAQSKRYYNFGGASSSSSSSSLNQLSTTLKIMPPSSLLSSSSLGFNSQMLLGGRGTACGLLQLSYDSFGLNERQDSICLSYSNNMQHPESSPSNSSNQGSAFISGVARTKTTRKYCPQPKGSSEPKPNKKSRPSCSPLQVKKEKTGDRIQTLQKLVTPFGKTNTASVLTEAIGYIHFLHDQIQTLSIPHMKSSQTRSFRMVHLDSKEEDSRKFNLRSRGLCLVPVSDASYIHDFD